MIEPDIHNDQHLLIFESYIWGVGMTPRMITNVETGENYRDGETAAKHFGVSRQAINNCIHERQETVMGCHLVAAHRFRKAMLKQLVDICEENGTDPCAVMNEFRALCRDA